MISSVQQSTVVHIVEPATTVVTVRENYLPAPTNSAPLGAAALSSDAGNALQRGSDGGLYLFTP